jgi:hypothetical protein
LWLLSFLFGLRVAGQALQRWAPQPFLPAFETFQGSSLPYGVLLASQLVILSAMLWYAYRVQGRRLRPSLRAGRLLLWIGGIYMAGSLARIVVGIALPEAPAWFTAWIPAFFHLVLASYVLTLGCYHRRAS